MNTEKSITGIGTQKEELEKTKRLKTCLMKNGKMLSMIDSKNTMTLQGNIKYLTMED